MVKILNFSVQVTDEEFDSFMERMANRAAVGTAGAPTPATTQTPSAPPALGPGGVELDSAGIPWIKAIHAPSKEKKQDGTWRMKKGVDAVTKASYEVQARQMMNAASPMAPVAAQPPMAPVAAPFMQQQPPAFPMTPAASAFPAIQQPPADIPVSFEEVLAKYQAAVGSGRMAAETFATWYPEMGINDPQQLATNETARKIAMKKLKQVMGEPV